VPADLMRPEPIELISEPTEPDASTTGSLAFLLMALAWPTFAAAGLAVFVRPQLAVPAGAVALGMLALSKWEGRSFRIRATADWLAECEEIRTQNDADQAEWRHANRDWLAEVDRRTRLRDEALAALAEKETAWKAWLENARKKDSQLRAEAVSVHKRLMDALSAYRRELADQATARRAYAVEAWLESHLIRDASIAQIGRTRVAMLASFGIETAADVVRLMQNPGYAIPGFGQRLLNNLWYWAADVQSRFDPASVDPLPVAATIQIKARYEPEVRAAEHRLERIASELAAIAPAVEAHAPAVLARLAELTKGWMEAESDLRAMQV